MRDLFVVNDLERLTEYGFEKTGEQNANGWAVYRKNLGETCCFELVSRMLLCVNPPFGKVENKLVVMCDVDYGEDVYSEAIWAFDELIQMLRDGVVDWVESTPS